VNSSPRPAQDYSEALARIETLQANDTPAVNPRCRTRIMTHGEKADRAIVFLHGFTNCPQQFHDLGKLLHERGGNVFIPRIPHHGLSDRLTTDLSNLTAEELAAFMDEVVDIAQGLGDQVTVAGLSGGAVAAAWAAQFRSDIARAVLISPSFAFGPVHPRLTGAVKNLSLALPNFFIWWNSDLKTVTKPDYGYPRFSTRALGQIARLGFAVQEAARRAKPLAQSVVLVTNPNDRAVDNGAAIKLLRAWIERGADRAEHYELDAALNIGHDIIDPTQDDQRVDTVYPVLIDLITKRM